MLNRRVRAGSPLKALQHCLAGYRLWIPCLCHVKEVFSYLMFLLSNMKGCGSLSDACSEPMEMSLHSLLYLIQPSSCLHTPHHCSCHSSLIHCSSFDWLHSSVAVAWVIAALSGDDSSSPLSAWLSYLTGTFSFIHLAIFATPHSLLNTRSPGPVPGPLLLGGSPLLVTSDIFLCWWLPGFPLTLMFYHFFTFTWLY